MKKSADELSYGNSAIVFKRYIWLIDLVSSQSLTREQILRKWADNYYLNDKPGVPMAEKTFHNQVKAIELLFDIRIRCRRYGDRTYYIENSEDLSEDNNNLTRWLISTISVSNTINESRALKDRILFENIPSGHQSLMTIISAMRDSLCLTMTYEGFWGGGAHTFDVAPYFVKVFKQRWYLIALSVADSSIRIYALDRIQDVKVNAGASFEFPSDFSPEEYFADCFGIIHRDDIPTETIQIKVTGNQHRYVRSLPLHSSQKVVSEGADFAVFEYRLKPTFDFIQEILSHGSSFEVLSPCALRDEVADEVRKMAQRC